MKKQTWALLCFLLQKFWYIPFLMLLPASVFFSASGSSLAGELGVQQFYRTALDVSGMYAILGAIAACFISQLLNRQQQRAFLFSLPVDRIGVGKAGAIMAVYISLEPILHSILLAPGSASPLLILCSGYVDFMASFYGAALVLLALQVAGNGWGALSLLYAATMLLPQLENGIFGKYLLSRFLCPLTRLNSMFFSTYYHIPEASDAPWVALYATAVISVCILLLLAVYKLAVSPRRIDAERLAAFPKLEWPLRLILGSMTADFLGSLLWLYSGSTMLNLFWVLALTIAGTMTAQMASRKTIHIWEYRKTILLDTVILFLLKLSFLTR